MKSVTRCYFQTILFPTILIPILTGIIAAELNKNYRSEWMTGDAATGIIILYSLFVVMLINATICLLFLIEIPLIRKNKFLTLLVWMLPVFISCILFYMLQQEDDPAAKMFAILWTAPYGVSLFVNFLLFYRKSFSTPK